MNHYDPTTEITRHYGAYESGPFQITHNMFWRALKTRDGLLWFATFNPGSKQEYMIMIDLEPHKVRDNRGVPTVCFAEDRDGNLLLGTISGVFLVEGEQQTLLFESGQSVTDLKIDREGNLWAATSGNGLFRYR